MRRHISIILFLTIAAFQSFADSREYPPLVGSYKVSYSFSISEYSVDDIANQSNTRTISYGVLYPTSSTSQERLKISDLRPITEDFNPIELKYKEILERIGQDDSSYDVDQALSRIQDFHKYFELNTIKNGKIIKDRKFPVLIFSPGAGGQRNSYLGLLEQIASLGVIVIALDQHQWEAGNQIVFNENTGSYLHYLDMPDYEKIPAHSNHHMRALDVEEVLRHIRLQKNSIFKQAILNKLFISGHSYGGHTAFYSMKLGLNADGFINYDGSFSPYGNEDHYDPNNEKINAHILCVDETVEQDGPEICENILDEFNQQDIANELASFKFTTQTGLGNISHSDFANLSFAEELFPKIIPNSIRYTRLSTKEVWHNVAQWTYRIIK